MVDTERSFWRAAAAGIALTLILAADFHWTLAYAVDNTTTQQTSTTKPKKKTARHPHTKPKPVPLDQLAPVPIEMGESAPTPLETFFQALAKLESPPPGSPQAPPGTPRPSSNPESSPPDAPQSAESPQSSVGLQPPPLVHIIHFGDSHVASDYWAGVLRERLQARFGDAGPGFVLPGRPWPTIRYGEARSLDGQGWRTDGLRYVERDGVVGLGGMSLESYREASPASAAASFSQFQILAATSPGSSCFTVQVDDADLPNLSSQIEHVVAALPPPAPDDRVPEPSPKSLGGGAAEPPAPLAPIAPIRHSKKRRKPVPQGPPFTPWPAGSPLDLLELSNSTPLAAGPHQVSIRSSCGTQARLLGMELYNGYRGVVYDTDGVNGARLEDLEKPLPALRTALLKQAQPTLIIVSYGTNDIGMKGFNSSDYEEQAFQILSKLKQDAGDASILVTGPTDRGSPRRKTRALIQAGQAALQPALRKAALRAGCAYWDQQAAMGGPGVMTRWVRAGLANSDYVHFSGTGYQKLANMLYDQLMVEYENFLRTSKPQSPAPGTP
jgi:lysophospholipase L1-like esterase